LSKQPIFTLSTHEFIVAIIALKVIIVKSVMIFYTVVMAMIFYMVLLLAMKTNRV
jgi:hypothetical protein